jgi:hypothetical protein
MEFSPKFKVLERIYGKRLKQRRSMLELMLHLVHWR